MLLAHHPGFSCPLCRSFADLESDVEVDVPEGYMKFGNSANVGPAPSAGVGVGGTAGGLEDVLEEEPIGLAPLPPASSGLRSAPNRSPLTRSPAAIPHIEMDDTSELARASEAISISGGSRSPIVAAGGSGSVGSSGGGLGTSPGQYASGATPVGDSMIDHAIAGGEYSHAGGLEEEEEAETMITSEAEAEERARRHRYRDDDDDEDVDEDGHLIDPAARRYGGDALDGRRAGGGGEDEEEEDEVNAHIGSM